MSGAVFILPPERIKMKFDLSTLKLSTEVKHQVAIMAKGYGVLNSNISASVTYPEPERVIL